MAALFHGQFAPRKGTGRGLGEGRAGGEFMGRLERYILLNAATAFVGILVVLTSMIWLATALRRFDLVTSQGQTFWVFLTVTGLSLPALMAVIAPIALFIAVAYTLNRLNSDSELVVMSAAGVKPWQLFRAPLLLSIVVAIVSSLVTADLGPRSLLYLRDQVSKVNADIVTNVAIPGRFSEIEKGLTFHIRERAPNGVLLGIFMNDARDADRTNTYLADRGRVVNSGNGLFLLLEQGTIHRSATRSVRDGKVRESGSASIVEFERYGFELSQFSATADTNNFRPGFRSLSDLLFPAANDQGWKDDTKGHRVELHKRLSSPLYPIAAFVIAFAFLGAPRTTRQSRGLAIGGAGAAFLGMEIVGLGSGGFVERSAALAPLPYIVPIIAIAAGSYFSLVGNPKSSIPEPLQRFADNLVARFERLGTT